MFSSLEPLLALETAWRPSRFFSVNLASWRFLPWSPCLHLKLYGAPLFLFPLIWRHGRFLPWSPCLRLKLHGAPLVFFFRQFGAPDVFFPGAPACTWNCMAPLLSFSPSIWRPWRFLPWSPCLHLKLYGAPLFLFPLIWRHGRFLPWSPCLHLKLHGAPLVLFSVNLAPLTFSSLEHLLALETAWRPSCPFLRQFGAPDVFFPGPPVCTWNCMAHLSSFSPSIWRPWLFLPSSPCLHLKLHGAPLVLFSVNLAPLTFSSLEPLLALETAWRHSRPFLRQFGAPDVFFPGAPACTWNCMAPLSSFSPSIWLPRRFLPWSPCLHLKLHGAPLVLFSVNLAPLTFSSLEPLLAPETAWRHSRPFLRQFGSPDVFFPGAPACTWNCMAPLSSFSPSIWRPWRFLPWSSCLHLKLHGAPLVLFSVNLAPLTFSSLEPLLALETAWRPSRHIDLTFFLSFFFLAPSFFPFFFLVPFFSSFLPSLFLSLFFFLSFWRPFGTNKLAHNYNIMQISRYTSHTLSRAQNWPITCVGSGKIL